MEKIIKEVSRTSVNGAIINRKFSPAVFRNETMKKIIEDEKIDTDRLWKLEAESPEKRYVRCIGFEYESKKYIVDSVLQKMFCENDPDYDETSYIINPEEQFYEYYGG